MPLRDLSTSAAFANLRDEIKGLIDARDPEADRRLSLLVGSPALAGSPGTLPLLQDALNSIQGEAGKLEAWFNATMDRVSARLPPTSTSGRWLSR